MNDKDLTKLHLSAVRSRKKSGARWQKISEINIKPLGEEDSAYRRHVGDSKESELATGLEIPRNFSVVTAMRNAEIEAETTGRVHKLLALAKQILNERQYAVFVLIAVKEPALKLHEVAKVLSISVSRAHQLKTTAMKKLRRAYDERTV